MKVDPAALYLQLNQLIASMPDLEAGRPFPPATLQWLGRAEALLGASGDGGAAAAMHHKMQTLGDRVLGRGNEHAIQALIYGALARAELAAPVSAQDSFIAAGEPFSALAAVTKVFARAKTELLLVDKYAEASLLSEFAATAAEGVEVQILTMLKEAKRTTLRPAVERWAQQFGTTRPLSVRMAPAGQLHDRLILLDRKDAWITGQSFNHFAETAPTYLSRLDNELAEAKVEYYAALWDGGEPL